MAEVGQLRTLEVRNALSRLSAAMESTDKLTEGLRERLRPVITEKVAPSGGKDMPQPQKQLCPMADELTSYAASIERINSKLATMTSDLEI